MPPRLSSARKAQSLLCHVSRQPLIRNYAAPTQAETTSSPKVIFSGIQPTGVPHLGNYLGAMQQWVKLQNEASNDTSLIFSVVDLHAITVHQNPESLRKSKREMLAALLAVGLDPQKCTLFFQSDVRNTYGVSRCGQQH